MPLTRRDLMRALLVAPATAALPQTLTALVPPLGAGPRNLIMLDLKGGNDGLNTVVPYGMNGGTYSSVFRPTLGVPTGSLLTLAGTMGLNPALTELKSHFDGGRLAIVNGVSYPDPTFSHADAERIWQTGDPALNIGSGWLGRALAQGEAVADPVAVSLFKSLEPLLAGSGSFVPAFQKLSSFSFPRDNDHKNDHDNRIAAYTAMSAGLAGDADWTGTVSDVGVNMLELIDTFQELDEFTHVGAYPDSGLADDLQLVVRLLANDIGMRCFHVPYGGFDTHADQELEGYHSARLANISQSVSALHADLVALGLEQDTLIVIFSEFGRTVYENGSGGTDHGSVGPVMILGDCVADGYLTAHPSMDPADLTDQQEPPTLVDFRDVFATLVDDWLELDSSSLFPGYSPTTMGFLA